MAKIKLEVCEPTDKEFLKYLDIIDVSIKTTDQISQNGYGIFEFKGSKSSLNCLIDYYYSDPIIPEI